MADDVPEHDHRKRHAEHPRDDITHSETSRNCGSNWRARSQPIHRARYNLGSHHERLSGRCGAPPGGDCRIFRRRHHQQGSERDRHLVESGGRANVRLRRRGGRRPVDHSHRPGRTALRRGARAPRDPRRPHRRPFRDDAAAQGRHAAAHLADHLADSRQRRPGGWRLEDCPRHHGAAQGGGGSGRGGGSAGRSAAASCGAGGGIRDAFRFAENARRPAGACRPRAHAASGRRVCRVAARSAGEAVAHWRLPWHFGSVQPHARRVVPRRGRERRRVHRAVDRHLGRRHAAARGSRAGAPRGRDRIDDGGAADDWRTTAPVRWSSITGRRTSSTRSRSRRRARSATWRRPRLRARSFRGAAPEQRAGRAREPPDGVSC